MTLLLNFLYLQKKMRLQFFVNLYVAFAMIFCQTASAGLNQFVLNEHTEQSNCDKSDNAYRREVQSHIRRYVNTFLRHSKLKNLNTNGLPQEQYIYTSLHIQIPVKHLVALQKFFKNENADLSLGELDSYLSDILYTSKFAEIEEQIFWVWKLLCPDITVFQFATIVVVILALFSWYISGLKKAIIFGVTSLTFIDAIKKYFIELRHEEIKQYMREKERLMLPPDCDPMTRSYWTTLLNLFREDPCFKKLNDSQRHYSEEVSFLEVLLNSTFSVWLELTSKAVGKAINLFADALSGGGPYGFIIYPILVVFVLILLMGLLSIYFGMKFKLNFLLGGFEFGDTGRGRFVEHHSENPTTIPVIPSPTVVNKIYLSKLPPRKRSSLKFDCKIQTKAWKKHTSTYDLAVGACTDKKGGKLLLTEGNPSVDYSIRSNLDQTDVKRTDIRDFSVGKLALQENNENENSLEESALVQEQLPKCLQLPRTYQDGKEDVSSQLCKSKIFEKTGVLLHDDSEETDVSSVANQSDGSDVDVMAEVESIRAELRSFCEDDDYNDDVSSDFNEKI